MPLAPLPSTPLLPVTPPTPRAWSVVEIDLGTLPPTSPPRSPNVRALILRALVTLRAILAHGFGSFGKQARLGKGKGRGLLAIVPLFVSIFFVGRWVSQTQPHGSSWEASGGGSVGDVEELRSRIVKGEKDSQVLRVALGVLRARVNYHQGNGMVGAAWDTPGLGDNASEESRSAEERAEELKHASIGEQNEWEEYLASNGGGVNDQEGVVMKEEVVEEEKADEDQRSAEEMKKEISSIEEASEILQRGSGQSPQENVQEENIAIRDVTSGSSKSSADTDARKDARASLLESLGEKKAQAEKLENWPDDLRRARLKAEEDRRADNLHRAHVQMKITRGTGKASGEHNVVVEGGIVERTVERLARDVGKGSGQARTQAGESNQESTRAGQKSVTAKDDVAVFEKGSSGSTGNGEGGAGEAVREKVVR